MVNNEKLEEYLVIFGTFIFMNYILPWSFQRFIKVVAKSHIWTSEGFEDMDLELEKVSENLKDVYKNRYLVLKDLKENKHCCLNRLRKYLYKEYLDRHLLYLVQKYSNVTTLKNTFDGIQVIDKSDEVITEEIDDINEVDLEIR